MPGLCPRCSVLLVALATLLVATPASAGQKLRIMTFNVENLAAPETRVPLERYRFNIGRRVHLERVAAVIEAFEPDIVNLVEVTSREAVDRLVEILHQKGLKNYQGHHVESADSFTGFDVAVIARHKPDEVAGATIRLLNSRAADQDWLTEKFNYVDANGDERSRTTSISRNAVYYFTVGDKRLGFLGLHLKANPDSSLANGQREAESRIARRIVQKEIVARGYLPIVLGDLNDYDADIADRDETRSTKTKSLANLKDFDPQAAGPELFNAAEKIVRQADRYTSHWDINENGGLDGDDVLTMIDHIRLPQALAPALRRTLIPHTTTLELSDHFPVLVDLEW